MLRRVLKGRPSWQALADEAWLVERLLWSTDQLALHAGYFDAHARDHARSLRRMRQIMAETVGLRAGERVLDAGCGVGGTALWLASSSAVRVVGINTSRAQLVLAGRHARRRGLAHLVSFVRGDLREAGLASDSCDVVWTQESVNQAGDPRAFLAEAHRLLRPGGRVIVEEFFCASAEQRPSEAQLIARFCRGCATSVTAMRTFVALARERAFEQVVMRDVTDHVLPSLRRQDRIHALTLPAFRALDRLGLRSEGQRAMRDGLEARRLAFAQGLLVVGICTACKPVAP